jgi:hypothetical protein
MRIMDASHLKVSQVSHSFLVSRDAWEGKRACAGKAKRHALFPYRRDTSFCEPLACQFGPPSGESDTGGIETVTLRLDVRRIDKDYAHIENPRDRFVAKSEPLAPGWCMMMREPDLCGGYRVHRTGGKNGFAYSAAVRARWGYPQSAPQFGRPETQKGGPT